MERQISHKELVRLIKKTPWKISYSRGVVIDEISLYDENGNAILPPHLIIGGDKTTHNKGNITFKELDKYLKKYSFGRAIKIKSNEKTYPIIRNNGGWLDLNGYFLNQ